MKLQHLQTQGRGVRVEAVAPPSSPATRRTGTAPGPTPSSIMDYAMSKPQAGPRQRHPTLAPRPKNAPRHPEMDGSSMKPNRQPPADGAPQQTGLSVLWLGTSSGAPTGYRNVSCTVVQMPDAIFLVDCGEGSHRQLQQANIDLSKVEGVLITHLHGDHCFGLATTLQMIDNAKSSLHSSKQQSNPTASNPDGSSSAGPSTAAPSTRVYGPPGLIELLRVSLALTEEEQRLHTRISVTELVLEAPEDQPLGLGADAGGRGSEQIGNIVAAWNTEEACSRPGAAGGEAGQAMVSTHKLGSLSLFETPGLRDAAEDVQDRAASLVKIWAPSRHLQAAAGRQSQRQSSPEPDETEYHGMGYIASFGRYWELPFKHARVRAAQLQHRVPCWGYVLEELLPAPQQQPQQPQQRQQQEQQERRQQQQQRRRNSQEPEHHNGMVVGRKVVILGDTISSAPVAPLALNCDVISHEATFKAGMEVKCRQAQHSTAYLAGSFADFVQAKHLVLTHFSGRYSPVPVPRPQGGRQGSRPGGKAGVWRERPVPEDEEQEEQCQAIAELIREARTHYDSGPISAAHDFLTIHVQEHARV